MTLGSPTRSAAALVIALVVTVLGAIPAPIRAQEQKWGAVKGRTVWGPEKIPERGVLPNGFLDPDSRVINPKNRGLHEALVWLINNDPKDKTPLPIHPQYRLAPARPVTVEIVNGAFSPHLVALREGQPFGIENKTPVVQQVTLAGTKNVSVMPIAASATITIESLAPERLPLCLGARPWNWLSGRVAVFAHPYHAVSDADGAFTIKDAPAGNYRLMIWSTTYNNGAQGRLGQPVVIPANGTLDLRDIAFHPPAGY
jgi:hypothetical protein